MSEKINIKMSEFKVANDNKILESLGIGSCVVICLYDIKKRIGAMAHVMLGKSKPYVNVNPLRFGDKSIDAMLKEMSKMGSKRMDIVAKVFGGANMFPGVSSNLKIGEKNITSVKEKLKQEGIRIIAEDIGGNTGRNIWFDTSDGKVVVGTVRGETKEY